MQLKYLKRLLSVKDSTCSAAVYAETGRFDLLTRQKIRSVKFWFRLERMHPSKLVRRAYEAMKTLENVGYKTWISHIKHILQENELFEFI